MQNAKTISYQNMRNVAARTSCFTSNVAGSNLVIDTDAGFDDFIAIGALSKSIIFQRGGARNILNHSDFSLTNRHADDKKYDDAEMDTSVPLPVHVPFISTVGGNQDSPLRSSQFLRKEFPDAHVVQGLCPPSIDTTPPAWLAGLREKLNEFMGYHNEEIKETERGDCSNTSTSSRVDLLFPKFLASYPDNSIDIMCLGPLTNVASWIRSEENLNLISSKVRSIWIMGGNLPIVPDDRENDHDHEAEFNFSLDPLAAHQVLHCPQLSDKIIVVPMDVCDQTEPNTVEPTWEDFIRRACATKQKGGEQYENNDNVDGYDNDKDNDSNSQEANLITRCLHVENRWDALKYDPICAFAYVRPEMITTKMITMYVDDMTGLLFLQSDAEQCEQDTADSIAAANNSNSPPPSSLLLGDSNSMPKIRFVTDVSLEGNDNFVAWLSEALITRAEN